MTRWLTIPFAEMKAIQSDGKRFISTSNKFNVDSGDNIQLECYERSQELPNGNSVNIYVNKVLRQPSVNFATSQIIYFNL